MNPEQKVTPEHLKRTAYLYVRQSTLRQVLEHGESARRQYALRQRAVALGWREDQIIVVDGDTAHTAASAAGREGFQQLVIEVGLGHAGLVMGLEVSRLARNCSDWHRLLELCALSDTLILDEEARMTLVNSDSIECGTPLRNSPVAVQGRSPSTRRAAAIHSGLLHDISALSA